MSLLVLNRFCWYISRPISKLIFTCQKIFTDILVDYSSALICAYFSNCQFTCSLEGSGSYYFLPAFLSSFFPAAGAWVITPISGSYPVSTFRDTYENLCTLVRAFLSTWKQFEFNLREAWVSYILNLIRAINSTRNTFLKAEGFSDWYRGINAYSIPLFFKYAVTALLLVSTAFYASSLSSFLFSFNLAFSRSSKLA